MVVFHYSVSGRSFIQFALEALTCDAYVVDDDDDDDAFTKCMFTSNYML